MLIRIIKSIRYTRKVYGVSKKLGKNQSFDVGNQSVDKAVADMKELWADNELLAPIVKKYGENPESLEKYYWELSLNGAGQWVRGYFVAVAALCFPVPLEYALRNRCGSKREVALSLLRYFEQGNPYLPVSS